MRFLKEYIILFFIIVFVISLEYITVKITKSSLESINYDIDILEEGINSNDIGDNMGKLSEEWSKIESRLCFYMEHSELEKISSKVVNLETNIGTNNREDIKEQLDEIRYRIEYVKDKQKMEFKNIF